MATTVYATLNPPSPQVAVRIVAKMTPPITATKISAHHLPFDPHNPKRQSFTESRIGWKHARKEHTTRLSIINCSSIPPPGDVDTKNGSAHSQSFPDDQTEVSSTEPYASDSADNRQGTTIEDQIRYQQSSNPDRSDTSTAAVGQWCGWEAAGGGSFHGWGPAVEGAEEASPEKRSSGRRGSVMAAGAVVAAGLIGAAAVLASSPTLRHRGNRWLQQQQQHVAASIPYFKNRSNQEASPQAGVHTGEESGTGSSSGSGGGASAEQHSSSEARGPDTGSTGSTGSTGDGRKGKQMKAQGSATGEGEVLVGKAGEREGGLAPMETTRSGESAAARATRAGNSAATGGNGGAGAGGGDESGGGSGAGGAGAGSGEFSLKRAAGAAGAAAPAAASRRSASASAAMGTPSAPAGMVESEHLRSLKGLQALRIIEESVSPAAGCLRRDFARWLVVCSNKLNSNPSGHVYPCFEDVAELAFDDVAVDDPDFPFIQGLAEAGIIASKLTEAGDSTSSDPTLFKADSPLSRQDLLLLRYGVEFRSLPSPDVQALRQKAGFLDAHRISTEALPAVAADLLGPQLPTAGADGDGGGGGEKLSPQGSMIPELFGNTRRFDPTRPVTNAQAALALSYGRARAVVREAAALAEQEAAKKAAAEAERQRLEAAAKVQEARRRIAFIDEERRKARQEREARDGLRRKMEERERREMDRTEEERKEREAKTRGEEREAVVVMEGGKEKESAEEGEGLKGKLRMRAETTVETRTGDVAPDMEKREERRVTVEAVNGSLQSKSGGGGSGRSKGSSRGSSSANDSSVTKSKAVGERRGRGVRKIEVKFLDGEGEGEGVGRKGKGEGGDTASDNASTGTVPAPAAAAAAAAAPAAVGSPATSPASTSPTSTHPSSAPAANSVPHSLQSLHTPPPLLSHLKSLSHQRLLQLTKQLQAQAQSSPVTRPAVDLGFRVYEGARRASQQAGRGVDAVRAAPGGVARVLEGVARDMDEGRGLGSVEDIKTAVGSGTQRITAALQSRADDLKTAVGSGVKEVGGVAMRGSEVAVKHWKSASEKVGGKWREAIERLWAQG